MTVQVIRRFHNGIMCVTHEVGERISVSPERGQELIDGAFAIECIIKDVPNKKKK